MVGVGALNIDLQARRALPDATLELAVLMTWWVLVVSARWLSLQSFNAP